MKKTLRVLCMSVLAAISAVSFAQTNVTNKLRNADMEKGIMGWDITFEGNDLWKKVTKNQSSQPGYYGVHNVCLEVWKSNAEPVANNSISQTLKGLPNGTYVFGAYMAATDQTSEDTRELIEGVTIFANDVATPVATGSVQNRDTIWAHTSKFNVAATVTDGTLKVGVNVVETSASFVLIDNATLYYFGEKAPEAALDEMAKIDIAAMLAIADTCLNNKMNTATLVQLNEAIEGAQALTKDAELFTAIENLGWGIRQAVKSIKNYETLRRAVKSAKDIASKEWTEFVAEALAALNSLTEEVETKYNEGSVELSEIDSLVNSLKEAAAYVELDDVYINLDVYDEKIDELEIGDEVGQYTEEMADEMSAILEEVGNVLSDVEEGLISALQAKAACNTLFAKIDAIIATPNAAEEFPITIPRDTKTLNNQKILRGSYLDDNGLAHFKSKTYSFDYPLTKIRFIIKESGGNSLNNGYPFVAISDFVMYDENDNPIDLSVDMLASNADHNVINNARDGAGLAGLIDNDLTTYFHTAYKNGPAEYHYIEVTLPKDEYTAFSFSMSARSNSDFHTGQFPAVLEIVHFSEAVADLEATVSAAKKINPYKGTDPGFYQIELTPFNEALTAAEALVGTEASESDMFAAIALLKEEMAKLEEAKVMPNPEKKYRIVSAYNEFFKHQNVQKAFTVREGQLWWETASPDSLQQEFTLEAVPNEESTTLYYKVRNVSAESYVNGKDSTGFYPLLETEDTLILIPLGKGEFSFKMRTESSVLHPCDHNSGAVGVGWTGNLYGTAGGFFGDASRITSWGSAAAGTVCSWYIREMNALPCGTKSLSDLNFQSETFHLYEGVNTLTFTADKECAFSDLVVYDLLGQEIPLSYTVNGAVATAILDVVALESFSFVFSNSEGVSEVTVDGRVSTLSALQDAYNTALAVAPVKGDEVGQYGDLSEYEAAIDAAEDLLAQGGTDEAIQQAVANLETAVANLGNYINYPKADKEYLLISGYQEFKRINGVDMAIYAQTGNVSWSYVNIDENTYRWKFVEGEPTEEGKRTFYVQNVATELFIGSAETTGVALPMMDEMSDAQPYQVHRHTDGSVALTNGSNMYPHFNSHSSGAGVYGNVIYWTGAGGASAIRIVEADTYVDEYLKELSIENIDITSEYVAPAVKGTFDLFGRRIDNPATTGIYIIDGKKVLVK